MDYLKLAGGVQLFRTNFKRVIECPKSPFLITRKSDLKHYNENVHKLLNKIFGKASKIPDINFKTL